MVANYDRLQLEKEKGKKSVPPFFDHRLDLPSLVMLTYSCSTGVCVCVREICGK